MGAFVQSGISWGEKNLSPIKSTVAVRRRLSHNQRVRAGLLALQPTFRQSIQNLIPSRRGDVPANAADPAPRRAESGR